MTPIPLKRRRLALAGLVWAALLMGGSLASAGAPDRVLLISSYHPGFPTFFQQIEGIRTAFKDHNVLLDVEFMDTKRFNDPAVTEGFERLLRQKLARLDAYDAVMTADDNALRFALTHQPSLFPQIPIVFLGVNDVELALAQNGDPLVTGVVEAVSMHETLSAMVDLLPAADTLVALADGTPSGQADLARFRRLAEHFPGHRIRAISLADRTWDDFLAAVAGLDNRSAVLLLSAYRDVYGHTLSFDDSLTLITARLQVPLFHLWYHGMGAGVLGGKLISHVEQGRAAGERVLALLAGTPADALPVIDRSPNRFFFDYRELERFGIPTRRLPAQSVLLHRPPSFYREHRPKILGAAALLALMAASLLLAGLNILRRRETETRLRASEARFRRFIENLPDAFFAHDTRGNIVQVNEKACSRLGYTREALLALPMTKIETGLSPQALESLWPSVMAGANPVVEGVHRRKDGSTYPVEVNLTAMDTPAGASIIGLARDISERKRKAAELARQQERFVTVLDSIDACIYVADMETHEVLFMNRHMVAEFGGDFRGRQCWEVFRCLEGPCPHCVNDRLVDADGDPTGVHVWHDRNPLTGKWYVNHDRAIHWTDGRLVKIQISTDITALKRMEAELRQAHKMEAIGTLAGGIAHDFNNILAAILGHAELAIDDAPPGSPLEDALQEIFKASLRAKELVRQILTYARQSADEVGPVRVRPIVKEGLRFLRASIPAAIAIRSDLQADAAVMANAAQLHQLLMNLCTNATHAMAADGGVLSVTLKMGPEPQDADPAEDPPGGGARLRLAVADTGCGIDPDLLDTIFDPYVTTKAPGKGTGLGLAVVQGIVERCGGRIAVDSRPGLGTTVTVDLPVTDAAVPAPDGRSGALATGSERVLLVDDEGAIVKVAVQILQRLGYRVTGMTSSPEALAHFRQRPDHYDLVVSDMNMPGLKGDRLAAELLAIRPDLPVIICTGYDEDGTPASAEALGIRAVLSKPLVKSELARAVRRALDTAGPRRA